MKIFNWIQRHRFAYNAYPAEVSVAADGSSGRRRGSSASMIESEEREPLLEEAGGDWELNGILTIGTLEIDPLQQDIMSMNYYYNGGDEEEAELELEAPYGVVDYHDEVVKGCEIEEEVEEVMVYEKLETRFRRVTLLDLFMADQLHQGPLSAGAVQDDDHDVAMEIKKKKKMKPILYSKLAAALGGRNRNPKKDVPLPVPPLKKLHKFMTKMMKKKIHPEMEARLHNKPQVMALNNDVSMSINHQYYNASLTESVNLLPTQGITA